MPTKPKPQTFWAVVDEESGEIILVEKYEANAVQNCDNRFTPEVVKKVLVKVI